MKHLNYTQQILVNAVYKYVTSPDCISVSDLSFEDISNDITLQQISRNEYLAFYSDYTYCETKYGVTRLFSLSYSVIKGTVVITEIMKSNVYQIQELVEDYIKDVDDGQNP